SANGAMNLVKAVVKIGLVAAVAYRVLLRTGAEAIGASGMTPAELIGFTGTGLRRLFLTMALALAVLGGLDYLWQRRRHELAQKIKDAARAAGVPIVERRALARALFKSVKVGVEIPPALYRAVAEILAYIYSLRGVAVGERR